MEPPTAGIANERNVAKAIATDGTDKEQKRSWGDVWPHARAASLLLSRDFEGLFDAMAGWPVTIRLLDPPLHEFLPDRFELHEEIVRARIDRSARLEGLESQFERVRSLEETNPMLGTRAYVLA